MGGEIESSERESKIPAGRNCRSHNIEIIDPENSTEVVLSIQSLRFVIINAAVVLPISHGCVCETTVLQVEFGYETRLQNHSEGRKNRPPLK